MARDDYDEEGSSPPRGSRKKRSLWFPALAGALLLSVVGFGLGVVIGVLFEEPKLLVGHVAGDSEEVVLEPTPDAAFEVSESDTQAEDAEIEASREASEAEVTTERETPTVVATKPAPKDEEIATLPPVSAAKPSDTKPAPSQSGKFVIQVGAFANNDQATAMVSRLRGKGYESFVTPGSGSGSGDARWRVRVGPFANREAAEPVAVKLKQNEKLPTWILAEEGG